MEGERKMNSLQRMVHALAIEKGWWPADEPINIGERLLLVSSEITEAFEEYREGKGLTLIYEEPDGKPCGFPIELADAVIRLLDLAEGLGINLEKAVIMKHEYNKYRHWRHGNKMA
jgi:NTP pyrophosphatase (non-canonical NTP hydrolase)